MNGAFFKSEIYEKYFVKVKKQAKKNFFNQKNIKQNIFLKIQTRTHT